MEEISIYEITDYQTMKQAIGNQLNRVADGFCKVGYLFKRARDESEMLKDSGYSDVNSFALAEFGLDKTQVSRFIRINDRFSIGGYSEHLKEKYEGFGVAKLSLMLTLPDEINEELSPEYTKSEINTIKTEYEAEQKITEMEVMMEELADGPDEFIAMIVKEMNDEHPEAATYLNTTLKMAEKLGIDVNDEDIKEAYIPEGVSSYNIRISGQGRFMVSMKEEGITIINTRDPANKTPLSWPEFKDALLEDMKVRDFPEEKESEKKPVKKPEKRVKPAKIQNEVAPVQPESVQEEAETYEKCTKADENVQKAEENAQDENESVQEADIPAEVVEDPEDKPAAGDEEPEEKPQPQDEGDAAEEVQAAAGVEKVTPDTEDVLTSSQRDMLNWLDLIRRKVVPEDGSRPDWRGIHDEVKTMERYVKQFTY